MDCKKIKKYLFEYAEGNAKGESKEIITGHLRSCNDCQKELQVIINALQLIETEKEIQPDPWFYNRFKTRMQNELAGENSFVSLKWTKIVRPVLVSVVIIFFAISGIITGSVISREFIVVEEKGKYEILADEYYLNGLEEENIEIILLSE